MASEGLSNVLEGIDQRIHEGKEAAGKAFFEDNLKRAEKIKAAVVKLEGISKKVAKLKKEIRQTIKIYDDAVKVNRMSGQTKLRITIRWIIAGEVRPEEIIEENTAAKTFSLYLTSLVDVYGDSILNTIARIPNGQSGLVSRNPEQDFINPVKGDVYAHAAIGDTGWSVKTHSSTQQKHEWVNHVSHDLKMPPNSVYAEVIPA